MKIVVEKNFIHKNRILSKMCGLVLLLIAIGMIIKSGSLCFGRDLWFDEIFSAELSAMPVQQMISLAAKDVHPPVYYLLIKALGTAISCMVPGLYWESCIKLVSVLPYVLLLVYGITIVRREFGLLTTGIFCFCTVSMPQLSAYTVEVRMYSLAMFFVTAMLLHGYEMVKYVQKSDGKISVIHLIPFWIYGILAAYSHYFSAVCAAIIYLAWLLGMYVISKRKSISYKKNVITWIGAVLLSVVAYVPWLTALLSQVNTVSNNYWIQPLTWRIFGGCIKFIFKPGFENETCNAVFAIAFFGIYVAGWIFATYKLFQQKEQEQCLLNLWMTISGVSVLFGLVLFGVVASIILRPVFVYRYMVPALGAFWLVFAVVIGQLYDKEICNKRSDDRRTSLAGTCVLIAVLALVLAIGVRSYRLFMWEEQNKFRQMVHTEAVLKQLKSDDILVYNFNQLQAVSWHYVDNKDSYLYGYTEETLIADICGRQGIQMLESSEDIKQLCKTGHRVLFIGSGNAREEIISSWEADGLLVKEIEDSCLLERYWFNVYEVAFDR